MDKDGGVRSDSLKVIVRNSTSIELWWRGMYTILTDNAPLIIIGTAAAVATIAVGVVLRRRRIAH